jgi:hypothetical protein
METPEKGNDRLAEELRAMRPKPRPEFTAELDERAAAGFPRRSRLPRLSLDRPRQRPARRLLLPVGGLAIAAIVAAAIVIVPGESDDEGSVGGSFLSLEAPSDPQESSREAAPLSKAPTEESGEASSAMGGVEAVDGIVRTSGAPLRNRAVERSAEITLGADPADVAAGSSKVFDVVGAHNGIVMNSFTREGAPGEAGASFELLIPSRKLSAALADLSAIDEVITRHEATADITAPTVNVTELLQDSNARIGSLLGQLQEAETESEREVVEAELRQERRHRARLRASLQDLQRRADLSRVLVRIETGGEDAPSDEGSWGIADAIDDAGKILAVAAAITVVALAVLGPIALIALLAWLAHRAWVRRERRRVLS